MNSPALPRVSIGVPVYNGSAFLREALDSLRAQSFDDIEILISDNCSSDSTEAICREYASTDARIRYVRQTENLGAFANFSYVLAHSRADYFMWNAADDIRSPDFVEINLAFLEQNPEYVASISPTKYVDGEFDPIQMGDASLEGTPEQNFTAFFRTWHKNGRFYSLYRRTALARCESIQRSFFASDMAVMLECCMQGKFRRSETGWTLIGRGGVSNSNRRFSAFQNHWYESALPFLELTKVVWRLSSEFSIATKAKLVFIMLRMNMRASWQHLCLKLRIRLDRMRWPA